MSPDGFAISVPWPPDQVGEFRLCGSRAGGYVLGPLRESHCLTNGMNWPPWLMRPWCSVTYGRIPNGSGLCELSGMRSETCIQLSPEDRARLEGLVAGRNTPRQLVWRARIVLIGAQRGDVRETVRATGKTK
jgi:hypothetical protein